MAITEAGINGEYFNIFTEAGHGTFNESLWMADLFGITMSLSNVVSVMSWSLIENNSFGYIYSSSKNRKPVYYVYQLFSRFGKKYIVCCLKKDDIRIYASKDDKGAVSIFIVNWDKNNLYSLDLSFNGMLENSRLVYSARPWSLTCLTVSPDLRQRKAYVYTEENAENNSGIIETNW